jgi:hypothetical protein
MTDAVEETVEVVLTGGPSDLPATLRNLRVHHGERKIKVIHRGGYEHFEREAPALEIAPVVYRWTTRTRIAE